MSTDSVVQTLFSKHVASCEVHTPCALDPLYDGEQQHVARAVEKRRREFQAGRHCARRALQALGHAPRPILPREDRAPSWPRACVGSITHTGNVERGFAAAVVAHTDCVAALGLDAEVSEPLPEELFGRILLDNEAQLIAPLPEPRRGLIAKLYFSAKEAFYKCQYPLSEQYLGFHDVELEFDFAANSFRALLLKQAGPLSVGEEFEGRFEMGRSLILTGVERPRRA